MRKPDNILEKDVRDALEWDPYVDSSRIVVKSDGGRITLTGAVYTYDELLEATDDAFSVGGVTAVDNQLLVGLDGEAIEDAVIASEAAEAIDKDRFVPKGSISLVVVDGWVTLSGQVHHHYERHAAERAVGKVKGVLGVTDNVVVSGGPMPSDVANRINQAFQRNAIIDDSLITVTTNDHTVYLDGEVGSGFAMEEAVDTAWSAPGVEDVVNRLIIVP